MAEEPSIPSLKKTAIVAPTKKPTAFVIPSIIVDPGTPHAKKSNFVNKESNEDIIKNSNDKDGCNTDQTDSSIDKSPPLITVQKVPKFEIQEEETDETNENEIANEIHTGDGGLDELIEDFNPSKIQYALLKVEDPKTSLPKFVLINWQVESGQNLSSIRSLSLPGRVNPRCEEGLVRHALQRRGEISVGTPSDSQCQERGRAGHLDDPGQGVQGLRHFLQLQREATR